MKCPIDDAQLVMSERSGIEIDYCPQCRGVWLDRGELDKIVERSGASAERIDAPPVTYGRPDRAAYTGPTDQYGRRRKKESWLSELFD